MEAFEDGYGMLWRRSGSPGVDILIQAMGHLIKGRRLNLGSFALLGAWVTGFASKKLGRHGLTNAGGQMRNDADINVDVKSIIDRDYMPSIAFMLKFSNTSRITPDVGTEVISYTSCPRQAAKSFVQFSAPP
jgi:hypothetical protein